uniref:Uncharacterized protein n=1 Tax=Rhizophora mucronata TaxID=61149 RepID=A0A2P2NHF0_RHIMU
MLSPYNVSFMISSAASFTT